MLYIFISRGDSGREKKTERALPFVFINFTILPRPSAYDVLRHVHNYIIIAFSMGFSGSWSTQAAFDESKRNYLSLHDDLW